MQQYPTILPPPCLPDGTDAPARSKEKEDNLIRFQAELEFIQCLSNPQYLHSLSTQGYFTKKTFINYLKYLEYWRKPEYVKFIVYPTSLIYLTLLQSELFRERLADPGFINELMRVGIKHHETWRVEKPPPTAVKDDTKGDDKKDVKENQPSHDEDDG
ncbi:hypothetical protein I302_107111 [Kwoniella bestiolae CBS 10118]|uniref:Mediator of RNA polymerase II transcription subunit 31 n=1 Tax=Kwoniella bestiolae CBS 10118 TaxID=1296100 RepID=A0A1B9FZH8_9TREE|nr:hypothetical protein I302_05624 [Kwoniella bestiolae CBS 10118]OCF24165.1 hypothetical protein I302_05624 [Kwoniella bestiolae CBS 10118]